MRKTIFSLLLILLLTQTIVTQAVETGEDNGQDKVYTDCTWYCDRIKAWHAYGLEYRRTYMFDSPITPKWISYYTTLLGRCLDSGTLPDGETCTLKKLPPKIPVTCPKNSKPVLGVCTACLRTCWKPNSFPYWKISNLYLAAGSCTAPVVKILQPR